MSNGAGKRATLIITSTAQFFFPFMSSAVNIALPSIGKEFSMEAVLLGWVATSYILVSAMFLVPIGRLADIFGRKKIFTYGIFIHTVATFLCAISSSPAFLISSRTLQGIGGALIFGTSVAILISVFPAEERGRAIGINMASAYAGLSVGPFIGGVMTQHLGWRSIFFLSVLLGLMVAVLVLWKLKGEWAEARGERFDVTGSIIFSLSLAVMMYGFSVLPTTLGIILVVLGVLGIILFIRWEAKIESPVIKLGLFRRNTVFVFSNLAILINYSATFAISFLLSLYLQYTKGFPPQTAGLILVAQPAFMAIVAPAAGRLSDRIEPRKIASVGMVFNCVALVLLIFINDITSLGFIITVLVVYGIGMGFFSSPNSNAIMSSVDRRFLGVAGGTIGTMRTTGMMLSMGIVMILFSVYIGKAQITPEYYPVFLTSVKVAFIIFAALCFGGIFTQLAGRKAR